MKKVSQRPIERRGFSPVLRFPPTGNVDDRVVWDDHLIGISV